MTLDFWQILAGLGLFLLGMDHIEQGLRGLGNELLVRILRRGTVTPWRGVLVGAMATALMQSSSLVGLLVLAFVGAGIMPMANALGVVVGTHVGTTVTGWLVATVGFKLALGTLALPLLALGGLGVTLLARQGRAGASARLLLGFGLLLFGLEFMKSGVEQVVGDIDLGWLGDYPVQLFALVGLVLATVLQSSSATMMISLAALHAGVISLPMGAAITVGAHVGTTSTMLLGVLRGDASSRRVAVFNVLYSGATALVALICFVPWVNQAQEALGITEPLYMLVAFHTFFTLVGVLLFYPLLGRAAPLLEKFVGQRRHDTSEFISKVPPDISEAATAALEKETLHALSHALTLVAQPFGGNAGQALRPSPPHRRRLTPRTDFLDSYTALKNLEGEILHFAARMHSGHMPPAAAARDSQLTASVRDAVYATKAIKDIRANLDDMRLRSSTQPWIGALVAHVLATLRTLETLLASSGHDLQPDSAHGVAQQTLSHLRTEHANAMRHALKAATTSGWDGYLQSTALNVAREVDQSLSGLLHATELFLAHLPAEFTPPAEIFDRA
ncbi:Na+/Picotransporter [Alcanivorax sp. S71-1-4]|uniref:Na/Pi cotransporter family protein n=1 Tax=Alcanivorax sp. S71-1-4 TaxID=1177159 RepID=UPI001358FE38|nr:Na/Pi symporter [Alcanivorax sp. S71-1-4]KAF0808772.1 Na+/Picotransporter [Alcanivorax sp. S71-1-4]